MPRSVFDGRGLELMNKIGVDEACRMAKAHAAVAGEGWTVPSFFASEGGAAWDFSYVDSVVSNGVATVTTNRPEAMATAPRGRCQSVDGCHSSGQCQR